MLLAKHAQILPIVSAVQLATFPIINARALVLWELTKTTSITHVVLATLDALLA